MVSGIIIDYLTFTSKIDSVDTIKEMLGFTDVSFQVLEGKGRYFYKDRLYFDGINIYFNGLKENMGVCVELSGKGCRNFEQLGLGDYMELFNIISCNRDDYNITRIDVAYDDFDGVLDFETLVEDLASENYVSRFREFKVERTYSKIDEKRSICIYFGSKKSEIMFRVYDKRAEQKRFDLDHWLRFEIQLRADRASIFVDQLIAGNDLNKLFICVINNYIRFIVKSDTDTNCSRAEMAGYWSKFVEIFDKISLFVPDVDYTETRLEKFVKQQASGSIVAFIALFGFDKFKNIITGRSSLKINQKYKNLLLNHGIYNLHELFNSEWWNTASDSIDCEVQYDCT